MLTDGRKLRLMATVTPLASIFGSGFLIIVPVLERSLGALSIVGAVAVCALAWFVGTAVRHLVREVEPLQASGELDRTSRWLEKASDIVIVVAYVISVALYLRIMAQYVVSFAGSESATAERLLASVAVAVIVVVGVTRGFGGLDKMERVALAAVILLTAVLGVALLVEDSLLVARGTFELPPVPATGLLDVLLVLGGVVITVQGFETIRYLGGEYDAQTRISASRIAQVVATAIYVGLVALSTPLMGIGTDAGVDRNLISITDRVAPLLAIPLVLGAVLSQFSAATADTVAAGGNLGGLRRSLSGAPAYVLSGVAAVILLWTVGTLEIIAVASRAFAAYYALQSVIAVRTSEGVWRKAGFAALAVVLGLITLFARPAG
ncbi:MAG: hypothetical protein ACR2NA_08950 [Solirubrobacterales bacterium]